MNLTLVIILQVLALGTLILLLFRKPKVDIKEDLRQLHELMISMKALLETTQRSISEEFGRNRKESAETARQNREELTRSLETFNKQFSEKTKELGEMLRNNFSDFSRQQTELNKLTTDNIRNLKETVEKDLKAIREDNTRQLEEMRRTVDEKLQKTLSERLSQSFETVGKQLQEVQKGLGEMRTLAEDVGGLKKVLSNVKMRGGIGEVQLSMLLEQILAPEQYEANVQTRTGSRDTVEFAIKLPGKEEPGKHVWLPVDAKFPKDIYEHLQDAYETGDPERIAVTQKELENTIRKMAGDIRDKYLDPPHTTDFGIMFLPFEGIYAEVVRRAALLEELQRKYKVIVTGPTTLAAILNSLQMGFRTLAIQRRSSEVWQILGAVKEEFGKFGGLLQRAQKNFQTGMNQLDEVVGVRTRAIERRLRDVESLPEEEAKKILPELDRLTQEKKNNEEEGEPNSTTH